MSSSSSSSPSPPSTPLTSHASLILYPPSSPADDVYGLDAELDSYDLVSPTGNDLENHALPSEDDPSKSKAAPAPAYLLFPSLLVPSLSLGALFLPHTLARVPVVYGAILVLVVVLLSAGAQSVWRGVGRYVRREGLEERVSEAFVGSGRGVRRERWKGRVGKFVRAGMVATGVGLGMVYLRASVSLLAPLISPRWTSPALAPLLTLAFCLVLLPLAASPLPHRFLPLLHVLLYVSLLSYSLYALFSSSSSSASASISSETTVESAEPPPPTLSTIFHQPRLALTIPLLLEALSTLSLLPLSLSPPPTPKRPLLPRLSTALSPLLLLPLLLLPPSFPTPSSLPPPAPILASILLLLAAMRVARTVVRPRLPGWRAAVVLWAAGTAGACLPDAWGVGDVIWSLTLASCLWYGYLLPALTHITLHHLRAPLSILYPSSSSPHDALLLKKERSMQARRETKRILHDLLVFGALLPVGGVMWGWALGRVVRAW